MLALPLLALGLAQVAHQGGADPIQLLSHVGAGAAGRHNHLVGNHHPQPEIGVSPDAGSTYGAAQLRGDGAEFDDVDPVVAGNIPVDLPDLLPEVLPELPVDVGLCVLHFLAVVEVGDGHNQLRSRHRGTRRRDSGVDGVGGELALGSKEVGEADAFNAIVGATVVTHT